jgi:hypothetical protein
MARETARVAATRATIAKLHAIIMKRYESYLTRRLPLPMLTNPATGQPLPPNQVAQDRLAAIRDLMRMEMPDRAADIPTPVNASYNPIGSVAGDPPIKLPNSQIWLPVPALGLLYYNRITASPPSGGNTGNNGSAELLYMIVSMGSPEALEQFGPSEIGDPNHDGYPKFLDGWGNPIFFIRWAPGFSVDPSNASRANYSDIQSGNPVTDHDPFDPQNIEPSAFKLIPLIYSAGRSGGLSSAYWLVDQYAQGNGYHFAKPKPATVPAGMMFTNNTSGYGQGNITGQNLFLNIGVPAAPNETGFITNHHLEAR